MSLFFGWLTWCFSYEISAIRVLHAYMFFFLLLLGMLYASWICGVLSCINFGKVSALLFKHLFSLVLSPSLPLFASSLCPPTPLSSLFLFLPLLLPGAPIMYTLDSWISSHSSQFSSLSLFLHISIFTISIYLVSIFTYFLCYIQSNYSSLMLVLAFLFVPL